ncbi:MAG TPA: cob(I)yrinic acid a,c-diamide adenosyltransferase [Solirubrobacteraceae bacterium]|nr:cob(I)yrinic acid a,c-diamide adenosyltransferase [Solirubrobacteraceae bacterium]
MVPTQTPERPPLRRQRSVVIVNTGHGKGKSTAAFGVVMRGVARGWRVAVLQFVKSGRWKVGEEEIATRLGVDWAKTGDGFTWLTDDLERSRALAGAAWEQAQATIAAAEHKLVVLDELTYPLNWGWIDAGEVAQVLRSRPEEVNVVITGRDAPQAIVEVADTVTEMRKVKHAYDRGVRAKRGLDF